MFVYSYVDFEMKMPIPSYLLSVVAGNLAFRKIGERCGIYSEGKISSLSLLS